MYKRQVQADPKAAEEIHENNVKRVIRALEYHEQTGGKISAHNEAQHQRDAAYRFYYFVLTDDRAKLYEQMCIRDRLSGILEQVGYTLSDSEEADFVIYNTCTVRDNANQRVYGRLGFCNSMKRKNPHKKIALCGCMMQEQNVDVYKRQLFKR